VADFGLYSTGGLYQMITSAPVKFIGDAFLIGAAISLLLFICNFIVMLAGLKQEKKKIINFLGPMILFLPQLYDDIGNRARLWALLNILLMLICGTVVTFAYSYSP
jgi:hypothetical protein